MAPKHAQHMEEFGNVTNIVHVTKAPEPASGNSVHRLGKRLFRRHRLQQYFAGDTLYRTMELRKVTKDELFLDLIIVANFAAIGHELRVTFRGWNEIEKFLLLFGAVYSVWRGVTMYWNLWESHHDVYHKLFVYAVFSMLTGIGIGAHGAFTKTLPWVAGASFLGNVIPWGLSAYHSQREELLMGKDNVINNGLLLSTVQSIGALPYFTACFVDSPKAARILFWIPPLFQSFSFFFTMEIFQYFHKDRPSRTSIAMSIEHLVEKFEILTLIVLGESLLAILFEAADMITLKNARINLLYSCVLGATAMVTSFAAFYINIDNRIIRGSKHAIRHNQILAMFWNVLHLPFHACLILFSAGLGIAFRDIIMKPGAEGTAGAAAPVVYAAEAASVVSEPKFGKNEQWLFAIGASGALVLSATISLCHSYGPREFTKPIRIFIRSAIVIALTTGKPFVNLSAELIILIFSVAISVMCICEYILVHADDLDLLKPNSSKTIGPKKDKDHSNTEEEEREEEIQYPKIDQEELNECRANRELQSRMKLNNRNRLVAVKTSVEYKGSDKV